LISLVLGGARSGKSAVAERRATALAEGGTVFFMATGNPDSDEDFTARVRAHQARRDGSWLTVEAGAGLTESLAGVEPPDATVLIDSLGTWVSSQPGFAVDVDDFVALLRARTGPTVVVSEEVGLGVHPSTEPGRRFRDALGELNQAVAHVADEVVLVVAGRVLPLALP